MAAVESDEFFREQQEHSEIKAAIVSDYFSAWSGVMIGVQKRYPDRGQTLVYMDLFSGPGKYDDGTESTPLLIMRQAIEKPDLRDRLVAIFNDKLEKNAAALDGALKALPGIDNLKYQPQVFSSEVDEKVVKQLESRRWPPTFLFVDPFGYKGLSLRLISSVLKHWGCDCVFFFNYNRINPGLANENVSKHVDEIFGEARANKIRRRLETERVRPNDRESFIVDEMKLALEEECGKFVLPFRFRAPDGARTTHHLFFVSKHFLGYSIMREVMRTHSHKSEAVGKLEYNPADARLPSLFNLLRPLSDLEDMLLTDCAGKSFKNRDELFESHSVGKPYVIKEYKEVLCRMEKEGKVFMDPPHVNRKKDTLGEKVKITFPGREE